MAKKRKKIKKYKFHSVFWPIFAVVVAGFMFSGAVYKFAYENIILDDIHSIFFSRHKVSAKSPTFTARNMYRR